jgi:hypothetical protein
LKTDDVPALVNKIATYHPDLVPGNGSDQQKNPVKDSKNSLGFFPKKIVIAQPPYIVWGNHTGGFIRDFTAECEVDNYKKQSIKKGSSIEPLIYKAEFIRQLNENI